jgi:hypothetical protein
MPLRLAVSFCSSPRFGSRVTHSQMRKGALWSPWLRAYCRLSHYGSFRGFGSRWRFHPFELRLAAVHQRQPRVEPGRRAFAPAGTAERRVGGRASGCRRPSPDIRPAEMPARLRSFRTMFDSHAANGLMTVSGRRERAIVGTRICRIDRYTTHPSSSNY